MGEPARLHRADVLAHTDAARDTLLHPHDPGLLDRRLRTEAAAHAAELAGRPELAAHYRSLTARTEAGAAADPASGSGRPAAHEAVRDWTAAATLAPAAAGRERLDALSAAGLDTAAVVSLAQVVAFVAYEVRVAVGRDLLLGAGTRPTVPAPAPAPALFGGLGAAPLVWHPWVPAVDPAALTTAQRDVLDRHATLSVDSPYYRTLLHDPAALDHRTHVYNGVMYGRGGLARADRELVTLVASRVNGCVYCAGVHARKFARMARDEPLTERILARGSAALADDPRRAALARFAERLAGPAPAADDADAAAVREAGLTDEELLDLVHCTALFGWANRLMLTLGAPAPPGAPCPGVCCTGTAGPAAPGGGAP
ncbi:peroxidase-related enzyme [Streptomyces bohaiensis]|uniref:Peroxidase-related enzyme n=1 Tax=Streptomyces bohaiensis TaxID=1431344 RepID=A0ABX1CC03_9ACTN|nr:peroxidase-related enzyme [Streptomyces bohaiensis]NJQ15205.1 peroxidase-related enzyme [Streptomyces bohaiensis]